MERVRIAYTQPGVSTCLSKDVILELTGSDESGNKGFLSLQDKPCLERSLGSLDSSLQQWVTLQSKCLGLQPSQSVFVELCALEAEQDSRLIHALLARAFHLLHHVQAIILVMKEQNVASCISDYFETIALHEEERAGIYKCSRALIVPPLSVRLARVEDYEDLTPILNRAQERFPSLAQLPEWCVPEEDFALARIIEKQDDVNSMLVAAFRDKLVGFMVCSADVEVKDVQSAFDLHTYDNLLKTEDYCTEWNRALQQLKEKGENTSDANVQLMMRDPNFLMSPEAPSSSTAFAVTMLCIDEEWEMQARDFLHLAFNCFPDKDFCIFTLSHEAPEPPLASIFNHVFAHPIPFNPYQELLLIFHRHGLTEKLEFMPAKPEHAPEVHDLTVGGMDIKSIHESALAFVAECEGTVVGVVKISRDVDISGLRGDFKLDGFLGEELDLSRVIKAENFTMNPIFSHRCKEFMLAAMQHMDAISMVCTISPEDDASSCIHCYHQIPTRLNHSSSEKYGGVALFGVNKGIMFQERQMMNCQIVVVGASECGLSAIERLLLDKKFYFTSITLLSPQAVAVGGVGDSIMGSNLAKLGLECRVTTIGAEMTLLDREERRIGLSNGEEMSYDYLILTSGLQDQTRSHLQRTAESKFSSVITMHDLMADTSMGILQDQQNIIVYGATIEAFHALSWLESKGNPNHCIRHVVPQDSMDAFVSCAQQAAQKLNLELPEAVCMTLTEVEEAEGGKLICAFEATNTETGKVDATEEQCDLLVACDIPDINPALFQCIHESSLVYDGRLVVNQHFQTNDSRIFGGGSLAKFSRSVTKSLRMENCNSREVGEKLGEAFVRHLPTFHLNAEDMEPVQGPPDFWRSKAVGCNMPGAAFFVFTGEKELMMSPSLDPPAGGRCLSSQNDDAFFQLTLDASGTICAAIYCGKMRVSAPRLARIMGLPASYFNGVVEKYDKGEVQDLMLFLHGGWAEALYHDSFAEFRRGILTSLMQDNEPVPKTKDDIKEIVHKKLQDFHKLHQLELSAYSIVKS